MSEDIYPKYRGVNRENGGYEVQGLYGDPKLYDGWRWELEGSYTWLWYAKSVAKSLAAASVANYNRKKNYKHEVLWGPEP